MRLSSENVYVNVTRNLGDNLLKGLSSENVYVNVTWSFKVLVIIRWRAW
jgi:hypothetical protein